MSKLINKYAYNDGKKIKLGTKLTKRENTCTMFSYKFMYTNQRIKNLRILISKDLIHNDIVLILNDVIQAVKTILTLMIKARK